MNFYKLFYFTIFLATARTTDLRVTRSGLVPPSLCKIGLEFYAELNNTSLDDLEVELIPDECCLTGEIEDCNSVQIVGECAELVPRETTKVLRLVAPLLESFGRVGFCTIHIDSRPNDRKREISRETLAIHFDTRIIDSQDRENAREDLFKEAITRCQHEDQDPLNDCMPVNCEIYYNGKRPYIDNATKRCTRAPTCLPDRRKEIYDPVKNLCVNIIPIADHDIEFVKSLARNNERILSKDTIIIGSGNKHADDNSLSEKDKITTSNSRNETHAKKMPGSLCNVAAQYIAKNKLTLVLLCLIIIIQCCMIIGLMYCMTSCSTCNSKKKVFCKFFNYRQDASVTTPLIGTSSDFTETTEFDFVSESSNIDRKIKCYKACQKENNPKISMSDDILSKCLNRRDWRPMSVHQNIEGDVKEFKVETDPTVYEEKKLSYKAENEHNSPHERNIESSQKVNTKSCSTSDKDASSYAKQETNVYHSDSAVSETEIQCFNYNFQHSNEFKTEDDSPKKTPSISTEKGAQASFSNDSIDDFLSERGMLFLGENASKLSFTSSTSRDKSSVSNITSKTSKNNIVKHILSYLNKSKHGTSSEPGDRKSRNKDLELIHLSRMSAFSSSGDLDRNIKLVKESRSSF